VYHGGNSVNEVIEILDSDEEVISPKMESSIILPEDDDEEDLPLMNKESRATLEGPSSYEFQPLDCSTFFLRSPSPTIKEIRTAITLPIDQGGDDMLDTDEADDINERLGRMSPDEWGMGDDEGFSESASTGQSEPEEERKNLEQEKHNQGPVVDDDQAFEEEMEVEDKRLEVIDLSEDDDQITGNAWMVRDLICPLCKLDLSSLDAEVGV
jgi:hypothetical protein